MTAADRFVSPDPRTSILVSAARGGASEPFGKVFERTAPALFAWAQLRIPPRLRPQLDPEDLVQEVWCRAIEALPGFDPARGTFRAWLFGIANHVLLKALRRIREIPTPHHASISRPVFALDLVPADVTSISRAAARRDDVRRFAEEVAKLDEAERTLLRLRGLEDHPFDAIATKLTTSAPAVRKRWQRLREKLEGAGLAEEFLVSD